MTAELKPFDEYIGLAKAMVRPYVGRECLEDTEMFSEALILLWSAYQKYEISRNVSFANYAIPIIINGLRSQHRSYIRKKINLQLLPIENLEEIVCEESSIAKIENIVNKLLSVEANHDQRLNLNLLAEHYLSGKSVATLAEEMQVTRVTIYDKIHKAIEFIKKNNPELDINIGIRN